MSSERRDRASEERIARGMAEAGREQMQRQGALPRRDQDRWGEDREGYQAWDAGGDRRGFGDRAGEDYGRYGAEDYGEGSLGAPSGGYAPGGYGREGYGRYAAERDPGPGGYGGGQAGVGYRGGYAGGTDVGPGGHGRGGSGGERGLGARAADEVASWFGDRDAERRREADHRGRGPKGYRRSDERLREDVNDRLADDSYVDATEIEVSVSGGEVTLSGTVDSRDARRRAEDLAEGVSGVSYVQNNIRVQRQDRERAGHSSGTSTAGGAAAAGARPSTAAPATGDAARAGGLGESIAYAAVPGAPRGDESGGGTDEAPPRRTG